MVFIEQKPLLNHELVRHAIVVLGKNVIFLPPLLAAILRGPPHQYWLGASLQRLYESLVPSGRRHLRFTSLLAERLIH